MTIRKVLHLAGKKCSTRVHSTSENSKQPFIF